MSACKITLLTQPRTSLRKIKTSAWGAPRRSWRHGTSGFAYLLRKEYGSEEGNQLVDELFKTIATTAYRASIELAKEKGSFPFLVGETEEETMKLREAFIHTGYMKKCRTIFAKIF